MSARRGVSTSVERRHPCRSAASSSNGTQAASSTSSIGPMSNTSGDESHAQIDVGVGRLVSPRWNRMSVIAGCPEPTSPDRRSRFPPPLPCEQRLHCRIVRFDVSPRAGATSEPAMVDQQETTAIRRCNESRSGEVAGVELVTGPHGPVGVERGQRNLVRGLVAGRRSRSGRDSRDRLDRTRWRSLPHAKDRPRGREPCGFLGGDDRAHSHSLLTLLIVSVAIVRSLARPAPPHLPTDGGVRRSRRRVGSRSTTTTERRTRTRLAGSTRARPTSPS